MKEITASGQTVEEAVQSALEQLNTTRDQVDIDVIDKGKKGLLGLFGSKPAVVKATLIEKETPTADFATSKSPDISTGAEDTQAETINDSEIIQVPDKDKVDPVAAGQTFIEDIILKMNISAEVTADVDGRYANYNLEGDSLGKLIGKRGQTLNALQYLLHLIVNKNSDQHYTVTLDAQGYRERRRKSLEALAGKMADKALHLQRKVALEPMPAFERKLVHNTLQKNDHVSTYSDGQDPHRHVVVVPKTL